ncbi:MAG TPA: response regulator [Deltaproteobacteria bacterium]|mgnify:CR=1 FL=1|nr:response regulator [Deltaproteobacteria bacterium]
MAEMKHNILLVDDSNVVKAALIMFLSRSSLPIDKIFDAADGVEALSILDSNPVSLVITDINMPNMDGEELVERMRCDPTKKMIPVVVISTEGSAIRIDHLKSLNVKAYLRKPFKEEEINSALCEILLTGTEKSPFEFLLQAMQHVVPLMASMSPRFSESGDVPGMQGDAINVRIEYMGWHTGELGLILERTLVSRIAARIMGLDDTEDISDDMIEDALRELMNVVCGHFITLMYGEKSLIDVSTPQVYPVKNALCNVLRSSPDIHAFMIDDSPALGRVRIKELNLTGE